jgi:hypothetical protein
VAFQDLRQPRPPQTSRRRGASGLHRLRLADCGVVSCLASDIGRANGR